MRVSLQTIQTTSEYRSSTYRTVPNISHVIQTTVYKMADACQGYKCEFLDSVPDDLYCKKCTLVAQKLSITTCCGESFCKVYIAYIQDNKEPCHECGATEFTAFEQIKSQKRINNLQVYCSMKERGCGWSGTLEQLDTHLDPHQDNCQYVDTECPLDCLKIIPKNNLDDHLAQHCVKRAYVCRYCSFKATYEEIVDAHLPQCKYVPLDCPNRCGATFERDFFEDHMKMCRLEEVECELRDVGCGGRFLREDQEEHARQNSQKHLTLTVSLAMETKEQLQQKLLELDQRHKEEEEKLKNKIEKQGEQSKEHNMKIEKQKEKLEKKLREQEKKLVEQEKKLEEQETKLWEQDKTSQLEKELRIELERELQELKKNFEDFKQKVCATIYLHRKFEMGNFSAEKDKDEENDWKSPAMYTHVGGYKFCIGVDANGCGSGRGKSIFVDLWAMPGEFDDELKWPAKAVFTIELIHQQERQDVTCSCQAEWNKPTRTYYIGRFCQLGSLSFLLRSHLGNFLKDNSLVFNVCDIKLL